MVGELLELLRNSSLIEDLQTQADVALCRAGRVRGKLRFS